MGELAARMPPPAAWLSASERGRLDGLGTPLRCRSFLAGRWLLRQLLAQQTGEPPAALRLDIDSHGRSGLGGVAQLGLSISHSGDWVAAVVAATPIGIDLERAQRRRPHLLALAALAHSPMQCRDLAEIDGDEAQQLLHFLQWWTLKEAWLKCRGLGLDLARMRCLDYREAAAHEDPQAACWVDLQRGLVLAVDGQACSGVSAPPGFASALRLRYVNSPGYEP